MKLTRALSLLLLALRFHQAKSHGVEVRECVTTEGNLRIFIEHWHGDITNPQLTNRGDTMTIRVNHVSPQVSSVLIPTGGFANTAVANLPGCADGGAPTLVSTCPVEAGKYLDWLYYDFPVTCNAPVSYTLLQGNTVVLTEACDALYPQTITGTFTDVSAPVIKIDGAQCDSSSTVVVSTNKAGVATWVDSVEDDCDPSPQITARSHTSGLTLPPFGCTTVTADAIDNTGKPADQCVFSVCFAPACVDPFVVQLDGSGSASIATSDVDDGTMGATSMSVIPTTFGCGDIGPNLVTLTATGVGGTAQCTTTVYVVENIAPSAACQNATVALDASGYASINPSSLDGGSSDVCGALTLLTANKTLFTCADQGANTVALTTTDDEGTSSSCLSTVVVSNDLPVVDPLDPVLVFVAGTEGVPGSNGDLTMSASEPEGQHLSYSWTTDCRDDDGWAPTTQNTTIAFEEGYEPKVCYVYAHACDICGSCGTSTAFVAVVNTDAGYVSGEGDFISEAGAWRGDPSVTGHASFDFKVKYYKEDLIPTGHMEFSFPSADCFEFIATAFEWLVVTSLGCAKFKGEGLTGEAEPDETADHEFMVTVCESDQKDAEDTFRIKIWPIGDEANIVYDNLEALDDGQGYTSDATYDGSPLDKGGDINVRFKDGSSKKGSTKSKSKGVEGGTRRERNRLLRGTGGSAKLCKSKKNSKA